MGLLAKATPNNFPVRVFSFARAPQERSRTMPVSILKMMFSPPRQKAVAGAFAIALTLTSAFAAGGGGGGGGDDGAGSSGASAGGGKAKHGAQSRDDLTTCNPGEVWDKKKHVCLRRHSGVLLDADLTEYAFALAS